METSCCFHSNTGKGRHTGINTRKRVNMDLYHISKCITKFVITMTTTTVLLIQIIVTIIMNIPNEKRDYDNV